MLKLLRETNQRPQGIVCKRRNPPKIGYIAHLFRNEYATVASLVDSILTQHIKQHKNLFRAVGTRDQEELRYEGHSVSRGWKGK